MLRSRKFTVREISIMVVVVAMVAIVSVLAIRSYYQYFLRARIIEAVSSLADMRTKMERYFQKNLTYNNPAEPPCGAVEGSVAPLPTDPNFTFTCPTLSATQFTVIATGIRFDAGISVFHRPKQQSIHAERSLELDGGRFRLLGDPTGWVMLTTEPKPGFTDRLSTSDLRSARPD